MNQMERNLLDVIGFTDYIAAFANPSKQIAYIDNYAYVIDYNFGTGRPVITDTAPTTQQVVMDSDSDFVLTQISGATIQPGFATQQFSLRFNPALLIQITDNFSQRAYFNIPTLMPLVTGAGGFPFLLPSPRVIPPRTSLSVFAVGAGTGEVFTGFFLALHGGRIFYK